jgi:hypothetical protein
VRKCRELGAFALASDLLGLSISAGMICRLERRAAGDLEAPVDELRE